jgi:hypothetical protein
MCRKANTWRRVYKYRSLCHFKALLFFRLLLVKLSLLYFLNMLQFSTLLYCVVLCISLAQAQIHVRSTGSRRDASQLVASTIELPLDHFNAANTATFSNRYWVNDEYYVPGGPVILFDAGESNAEPDIAFITADPGQSNAMIDLAERFGACVTSSWKLLCTCFSTNLH